MSFTDERDLRASKKVVLIRIEPTKDISADLVLSGGTTYTGPFAHRISAVRINGANVPSWSQDSAETTLTTDIGKTLVAADIVEVDFYLFMSSGDGSYHAEDPDTPASAEAYWRPTMPNPPGIKSTISTQTSGVVSISSSPFTVINVDRFYNFLVSDTCALNNRPILIWFTLNGLENSQKVLTSVMSVPFIQGDQVQITVKSGLNPLKALLDLDVSKDISHWSLTTFPDLQPGLEGKPWKTFLSPRTPCTRTTDFTGNSRYDHTTMRPLNCVTYHEVVSRNLNREWVTDKYIGSRPDTTFVGTFQSQSVQSTGGAYTTHRVFSFPSVVGMELGDIILMDRSVGNHPKTGYYTTYIIGISGSNVTLLGDNSPFSQKMPTPVAGVSTITFRAPNIVIAGIQNNNEVNQWKFSDVPSFYGIIVHDITEHSLGTTLDGLSLNYTKVKLLSWDTARSDQSGEGTFSYRGMVSEGAAENATVTGFPATSTLQYKHAKEYDATVGINGGDNDPSHTAVPWYPDPIHRTTTEFKYCLKTDSTLKPAECIKRILNQAGLSTEDSTFSDVDIDVPDTLQLALPINRDTTYKETVKTLEKITSSLFSYLYLNRFGNFELHAWPATVSTPSITLTDTEILETRWLGKYGTEDMFSKVYTSNTEFFKVEIQTDKDNGDGGGFLRSASVCESLYGRINTFENKIVTEDGAAERVLKFKAKPDRVYTFSVKTGLLDAEIGSSVRIEIDNLPDNKTSVDLFITELTKDLDGVRVKAIELGD